MLRLNPFYFRERLFHESLDNSIPEIGLNPFYFRERLFQIALDKLMDFAKS